MLLVAGARSRPSEASRDGRLGDDGRSLDLGRRSPTRLRTPDADAAASRGQRAGAARDAAVYDRRHAAGRRADGDHAVDGHVRLVAGRDLRRRLHARRPRLLAVLHATSALFVFSMTMLVSVEQLRAAVRVLGSGRRVQLPADRLLVREARGGRGRQEGVSGQPHRRLRLRAWACS